ncbi:hypothetical protein BCR39DRAFT_562541 [Naematelia encephala]|uniref:Uncharacterized protein n=1 Tax=Naematelia encephala TaxID=71784 RepID=A0A1Y2AH68_9TREE|nr:hypothetical protein BCR39DRAFT_562541 [Naematelia encephala]
MTASEPCTSEPCITDIKDALKRLSTEDRLAILTQASGELSSDELRGTDLSVVREASKQLARHGAELHRLCDEESDRRDQEKRDAEQARIKKIEEKLRILRKEKASLADELQKAQVHIETLQSTVTDKEIIITRQESELLNTATQLEEKKKVIQEIFKSAQQGMKERNE